MKVVRPVGMVLARFLNGGLHLDEIAAKHRKKTAARVVDSNIFCLLHHDRNNGIQVARVFSSRWCRCLETAELLKLGPVEKLPELDSFFQQYERRDSQTENLRAWISKQKFDQAFVLVTHQVNITALTGFYPASGELVFAKRSASGEISFLGSIKTERGKKV